MSELQTTPRLSLFQIESELLGLIELREDALERSAALPDAMTLDVRSDHEEVARQRFQIAEEITAIDGLIRTYLKAEIKKVDGIAFAVKEFEARSAARAKEAAKMKAQADRDAETAKRIKAMVLEVMQEFGEKKLPGRLFTISRQGNGGVQALTIAQPDLIPLNMQCATVEIAADAINDFADQFNGRFRLVNEVHPDLKSIREALERGEGVMGAKLEPRGEHVRIR